MTQSLFQVWLGAAGVLTLCGVNLARAALRRTPFGALQPAVESSSSSEASSTPGSDVKKNLGKRKLSVEGEENDTGKAAKKRLSSGSASSEIANNNNCSSRPSISRNSVQPASKAAADTQDTAVAAPPRRSRKTDSHHVADSKEDMSSGVVCQLLDRPVSGLTLDKHRAALASTPTVTVKALRNVLDGMGTVLTSSMLKDDLIHAYVAKVHGVEADTATNTSTSIAASGKRKSTLRVSEVADPASSHLSQRSSRARKSAAVAGDSIVSQASVGTAVAAEKKPAAKGKSAKASACPVSPGHVVDLDRCKFLVKDVLAPGADSTIFRGSCTEGKHAGTDVAIKVQARAKKTVYQVTTEYSTLRALHAKPNPQLHIQTPIAYGCHNDEAYILVTKLLGPNLLSLVPKSGAAVPAKTLLLLALQGLPLLEALHTTGYVHRDIKPDNIVICSNSKGKDQLFLIDFGTAEALFDRKGARRTTPQAAEGTLAYMAMSVHKGEAFSARDDLEAFGWMMLRLLVGKLPWESYTLKQISSIAAAKSKMVASNFDLEGVSKPMQAFFKAYFGYIAGLDVSCGPEHSKKLCSIVKDAWKSNQCGALPDVSSISFK